ncbi:hypothetical protein KFL_000400370 [Klebsormidium nitens]|uniref:Uncharacterized protein n=1 Tax=Klebsormidium nitens TaxID=105231 RepID=A0A1Y1HPB9_KLENI|nr:hypothetical protein KFL_000400370 [Klebsormidium nitens]|eukprot:GAQ79893.1 hypothetical protein KFL_000400370 [Klebsormidium nitens]
MAAKFGGSLSTLHSGGLPADYLEKQEQKTRYAQQQIRDKKERLRREKDGGGARGPFEANPQTVHQRRLLADGGAVLANANGGPDDSLSPQYSQPPHLSYQGREAYDADRSYPMRSPEAYNAERSFPGRSPPYNSTLSPNSDSQKNWSPAADGVNALPSATWQSQNEPWSPGGASQTLSPDSRWGGESGQSVSPPKARTFMSGVADLHGVKAADRVREEQRRQEYAMELERQVQEKARAKAAEREARIARERREEQEAAAYNPWGRGGGGAPLRDPTGGIITELRGRRTQPDQASPGHYATGSSPGSSGALGLGGFQPAEQQTNFRRRNHFTSGAEQRNGVTSPLGRSVEFAGETMSPRFGGVGSPPGGPSREDFAEQTSASGQAWQEEKDANWGSPTSQTSDGAKDADGGNHSYGRMRQERMSEWERAQFAQKQAAKERVQAELRAQIEEKKRRKDEEDARRRREEEAQERRIAQDQERMRAAFEAEQAKARAKATQFEAAAATAAAPAGKAAKGRPRGGQVVEISGDDIKSKGLDKAFEEPAAAAPPAAPSPRRRPGRDHKTSADEGLDAAASGTESFSNALTDRRDEVEKESFGRHQSGPDLGPFRGHLYDPPVSKSPLGRRAALGRVAEEDSPDRHVGGGPGRHVADGHSPGGGFSEMEKFQMQMRQEQMEMMLRLERQERELGDLRAAALSSQAEARAAVSELEKVRYAMRLGASPLARSTDSGKLSLESPVGRLELALLPINSSFDFGGVDVAASMHSESMMIYPPNAKLAGGSRLPTRSGRGGLLQGGEGEATYDPIALASARPLSSLPGGRAMQNRPPSARIAESSS